ncbi:MAG: hypothetical protein HOK52_07410 [Candidatus Marinimicrobia bacterium]|jgi:hypothetical protein|nr:hypothetical protein [Candidatus Woesearchaeota archaeon]MBT6471070.1 hypothetical protein [Candidatus Neomarinimicrobiota bacterium]
MSEFDLNNNNNNNTTRVGLVLFLLVVLFQNFEDSNGVETEKDLYDHIYLIMDNTAKGK